MRSRKLLAGASLMVLLTAAHQKGSSHRLIVDIPAEGGAGAYCSVSKEISVKDSNGQVIAVLDQICVTHKDIFTVSNGRAHPATHSLASHWSIKVKSATKLAFAAYFQDELFEVKSPTIRRYLTLTGNYVSWGCNTSSQSRNIDNEDRLDPSSVSIMEGASSTSMIHITVNYYDQC